MRLCSSLIQSACFCMLCFSFESTVVESFACSWLASSMASAFFQSEAEECRRESRSSTEATCCAVLCVAWVKAKMVLTQRMASAFSASSKHAISQSGEPVFQQTKSRLWPSTVIKLAPCIKYFLINNSCNIFASLGFIHLSNLIITASHLNTFRSMHQRKIIHLASHWPLVSTQHLQNTYIFG